VTRMLAAEDLVDNTTELRWRGSIFGSMVGTAARRHGEGTEMDESPARPFTAITGTQVPRAPIPGASYSPSPSRGPHPRPPDREKNDL
jgi:hypothetical protein